MTDILLINPNTTASITDLVLKTAKRFASKGTSLRAVTGAFGPRYIASRVGYAIAGHAAVDAFANDRGRKDAVVLACFGDPGLAALKEIAKVPVVGMADASILQACAWATASRSSPAASAGSRCWRSSWRATASSSRLASIRTVAPTGADIARNPKAAMALLAKGCSACVREDGADVVILGGAGLAGLAAKLKTQGRCAAARRRRLRDLDGRGAGQAEARQGQERRARAARAGRQRRSVAGVGEAARSLASPVIRGRCPVLRGGGGKASVEASTNFRSDHAFMIRLRLSPSLSPLPYDGGGMRGR